MAQSIGPLSNGLGTISTAWLQQDAQMLQAGQKEDDAAAAMAEQSISDATSMYGQSLQASAAALQTIQAVLQARVQADRSVYRVGA